MSVKWDGRVRSHHRIITIILGKKPQKPRKDEQIWGFGGEKGGTNEVPMGLYPKKKVNQRVEKLKKDLGLSENLNVSLPREDTAL